MKARLPFRSAPGQSAILIVAVVVILSLIVTGLSLSRSGFSNATANVSDRDNMQVYYVARAGVEEALATRMVPRTNYLNFANVVGTEPMFALSGRVYQNPANISNSSLLGYYQYIILGGDPARDPSPNGAGNFYTTDSKNGKIVEGMVQTNAAQPYYVVSRGSVCEDKSGLVLPGTLSLNTANGEISCSSGHLRQMTVIAEADFSRTDTSAAGSGFDAVRQMVIANDSASVTLPLSANPSPSIAGSGSNRVLLPGPSTTPSSGGSFNFDDAWMGRVGGAVTSGARPVLAMTYMMTQPRRAQFALFDSNGVARFDANDEKVHPKAVMKIFFQTGVDYRSIVRNDEAACQADPSKCNIKVERLDANDQPLLPTPQYYNGGSLVPHMPSSSNLIVFPPFDISDAMSSGTRYRVVLNKELQDFRGQKLDKDYYVYFVCSDKG